MNAREKKPFNSIAGAISEWEQSDDIGVGIDLMDRQTIIRARIELANVYANRGNPCARFLLYATLGLLHCHRAVS